MIRAERARVRDALLKLGQGRAAGETPLVLACTFVLRSHCRHLPRHRMSRERGPSGTCGRVAELYSCRIMRPAGTWAGPKAREDSLLAVLLG
jgi:hypothetical protein